MYKLLPDEEKARVAKEYSQRRQIVMLVTFIFVAVVAMVGLFPSYMLSNSRLKEVAERVRIMGEPDLENDESELRSWLSDLNQKIRTLSPKLDKDRPSDMIEEAINRKVNRIKITSFEWGKDADTTSLSVSGTALDRQALIAFEDSLNASGRFATVSLPVSNLARDKDIGFRVKLILKPLTP